MIYCGIDPGITGAIAWFEDGKLWDVRDLPMVKVKVGDKMRNQLAPGLVGDWLAAGADHVYLEHVSSRPGEGAVGAFSFGRGFGQIEGVMAGMRVPYTLVRPGTWKKKLGVPADKGAARAVAMRLFPDHAGLFARVKDDGRAESALIALYGSLCGGIA